MAGSRTLTRTPPRLHRGALKPTRRRVTTARSTASSRRSSTASSVLTDGQGARSKWSEPAELLFGLDAAETLGKGLFRDARRLRARGRRGLAALPRERRGA